MKKTSLPLMVLCLIISFISVSQAASTVNVTTSDTYQTMDGFGASITWYETRLTEHSNKGNMKIQMFNGSTAEQLGTITPRFNLVNTGETSIALSDVKIRYYYTVDGDRSQEFWCDWSTAGKENVTGTFVKIDDAMTDADYFLEVGFTSDAGSLAAGQSIEVQTRIAKSDWDHYTQTDDYSFNSDAASYQDWEKVTGYLSGALQWGIEPTDSGDDGGDDNGDAGIDPTTATFDKNAALQADIAITMTLNGHTLETISDGSGNNLAAGGDYTVSDTMVTVHKGYLADQNIGTLRLVFTFSGGSHSELAVKVIDTTGTDGEADTTAPSAPTDLEVTAKTSSSISLVWSASTDDVGVAGYDVYCDGILATSVITTSANVTDLAADTTYHMTVTAMDASGNVSPESPILSVTTAASDSAARHQSPYPEADPSDCGGWALVDNVCCARYCVNDDRSENCDGCGGNDSPECVTVGSKGCMSGEWPEVFSVSDDEPWHYSRSTHFGLTSGGACGFGLYGLCTTRQDFIDANLGSQCDAFCKAYPALCTDPAGTTLRGNFAAPPGNYYTQFWPSLPGDRDNYLSCGECYEVIHTKKDGSEYQPGEEGYTPPITLQLVDSCPCSANSKWCCGSGRDHCGEVSDYKYGCQLPPSPPDPPADHDPLPNESIHLDLSDIAMARLQTGSAGTMVDGIIPIKYRRVPCPVVGNVYIWLRDGAGPYWFALSVVNVSKLGSVVKVEVQEASGEWVALVRDPNYTSARPQERYGAWVLPQGAGPFSLPVSLRITDPSGKTIVAEEVIKSWAAPDADMKGTYYIDTGMQF
jgi:hypothetical protein